MTVTNTVAKAFSASGEFFIVDSDLTGADYGIYVQGNTKPIGYAVVKGSKIRRSNAGQHTSRIEEGHKILYQDSSFRGPGNQTSSRMGRATEWVLFQGNYMNQPTTFGESGYTNQYFVVERNILDVDTTPGGTAMGLLFESAYNAIARNNVVINGRGGFGMDVERGRDAVLQQHRLRDHGAQFGNQGRRHGLHHEEQSGQEHGEHRGVVFRKWHGQCQQLVPGDRSNASTR